MVQRFPGRFTAEISKHAVGFIQDIALLLDSHVDGVFVRVAVQTDFVPAVSD